MNKKSIGFIIMLAVAMLIIKGMFGLIFRFTGGSTEKERTIASAEVGEITTPEGTAPRLPYQVWVTYSDGSHGWRQVRWTNSPRATEEMQANAELNPAGKQYDVTGYVIGDNTTENGFPVTANVTVVNEPWKVPANRFKAEPLPLGDVQLTGDNRLTNNRDLDIKNLLALDITQQLYNYRDTYGLPTEGYTVSDGWDSPTTKLKGHGTGHYLSALAFAYASAQHEQDKAELFGRIERMVNELRECQERTFVWDDALGRYREARDYAPEAELKQMKGTWADFDRYKQDYKKYGYGYLNAIPAAHPALIECYRAYNNEAWVWAPYYSIHKQLAGLIDIYHALSNATLNRPQASESEQRIANTALIIAKDMGLWVWNRMHYRTFVETKGTKAERQSRPGNRYEMWNMYIAGEVGGMAESLSRLSEMATDPVEKERLLEAANCFDTPALFDPVSRNIDDIRTRHANQHIPMFIGALRSYLGNNNPYYYNLAYNFWNMIQGRYTYATGGVGNGEMWRQPYSQILSMNTSVESDSERNMYPNPNMNETCCAYNLAKLSKDLNCFNPDDARYMDYYERVLYNQLVGSVHPTEYGVTYQYAVGMNAIKPFGNETPQSSCCGGTGAENHVKYQEAAYFVNDNTMWVALYLPTVAEWKEKGATVTQECKWPAERSTIRVQGHAIFAMKLRVPYWATEGFDIKLNGKSMARSYQPCSYFEIPERVWATDDVVEVFMPFTKHINFGPDKMDIAATGKNETRTPFNPQWVGTLMYGPLAMATSDIHSWDEAEFNLPSDLSTIILHGASSETGYNGNLYSLTLCASKEEDAKTYLFLPDYYHTDHATHYLRLNVAAKTQKTKKGIDKSELQQALQMANERVEMQNAWNTLTVKVPAFAPWAPHGYARLQEQLEKAQAVMESQATQEEINAALSALNVAINTMRPGNLAEPEDLGELLPLLTESKKMANKTTPLREAINYADMVVGYVNDGSGTNDLIEKALTRLKDALKQAPLID